MNLPHRKMFGISLIAAPLFSAASTFYWLDDGQYSVTAAKLLIVSMVFWITGFVGVFRLLEDRTPRYAAWGLWVAVYGAVCGGAGFAFLGLFMELFGVAHDVAIDALNEHPLMAEAVFWIGGAMFPLSLLVLGIVLAGTRILPPWLGILLALSGLLFPVARIPRIQWLAHLVDLAMLLPMVYLGWRMRSTDEPTVANAS